MRTDGTIHLPSGGGRAELERGSILLIGNATVLIRYAGFTLLTDPTLFICTSRLGSATECKAGV